MEEEKCESKETKCCGCGKNEFRLTRVTEHRVLAECIHCGHSHTLDSILGDKKRSALLHWFTESTVSERCMECRSPLRIQDVSVETGHARILCEKCGLLHIYKKDRLHGWHVVRVTRRVNTTT